MSNASLSAREFAASMKDTGMSIDEFAQKQRILQIQSQIGGTSLKSCAAVINTYNGGLQNAGFTQEEFNAALMQSNPIMARYLAGLNGSNASLTGYIAHLIGAKLATIGLKIATHALNAVIGMGIGLLISWAMELVSTGIEYLKEELKSTEEKLSDLNETIDESVARIKQLSSDFKSLSDNASDVIPKFVKLAKGVDSFGNKVELTDDEYAEFIELNNKIAEMFPELNMGFDDNGNAMLALSYSADTLSDSLWSLVEAEREATRIEIAKNLGEDLKTISKSSKEYDNLIKKYKKRESDLEKVKNFVNTHSSGYSTSTTYTANSAQQAQADNDFDDLLRSAGIKISETVSTVNARAGNKTRTYTFNKEEILRNYENEVAALERQIEQKNKEKRAAWQKLNPIISAWLQTTDSYSSLSDEYKQILLRVVGDIDYEKLGITGEQELKNYIQNNFVAAIAEATPEVQQAMAELFNTKELFEKGEISYNLYKSTTDQALKVLKDSGINEAFINSFKDAIKTEDLSKELEYVKSLLKDEFKDAAGDLNIEDIKLAYKIYAKSGSLTLDELYQKIEELGWLGADMIDSIDLDTFTDKLDDVTNGLDKIVSSMQKLKEGTALSANEIVNLLTKYPELLKQANLFTDNSIEGQNNMLQNLLNIYEAEYDATIETKIAELKATNECLKRQMEVEEQKYKIVLDIKKAEVEGEVVSEAWLADKIAEFNSLQAQNYVTMSEGKLTVNSEVLKSQLEQDASAAQGTEDIWGTSTLDIADFMVLTAERAKTKVSNKVKHMAQKVWNFAKQLMGWNPGEPFAYTDTGTGDNSTSTGLTYSSKVNTWIKEQENIYKSRMDAIQKAYDENLIIIDNLENLKGLDLTTILDTGKSSGTSGIDEKNSTETIDYIAIALDRAKESLDKFKSAASSAYSTLSARSTAVKGAINAVTKEINTQYSAAQAYLNAANSVGLSNTLVAKIQNGSMNISEYDNDTADKIKAYQDYYEKYLACIKSAEDLKEELASLYKENFDNIQKDYSNRLTFLEHSAKTLNNQIDLIEAQGHTVTASYYNKLIDVEKGKIDILYAEKSALEKALNEAVASGKIAKYSEAWYEMMNQIYAVDEAIQEGNIQVAEFNKEIRNIEWDAFDAGIDKFDKLLDETDFLIKLLKQNDLVDENGKFTKSGKATIGLHSYNYKVYLAEAEKFADEIERLNAEIAKDPSNKELIERRDELLEKQRDSILAAQDEKDAIKDLVEDAIDAELDALKDLIDKYKDAMDEMKSMYDYQKKVADQTDEISVLQKKIIAYENDTSEEAKAQIQKLKVDLEKAQEELQETEYDQFISDQKKMLDNLYDDYESVLNRRLDNIDSLIGSSISELSSINSILGSIATASGIVTSGKVPHYAAGGMNYHTGFAWLDGTSSRPEAVLNAQDTSNFIALRELLRTLASNNITYGSSVPNVGHLSHTIPNYSSKLNSVLGTKASTGNTTQYFDISIPIERVEDYNDFVEQLQKDKKFEKMVRAMTIDQAFNGTSLSKNKVVWRNK